MYKRQGGHPYPVHYFEQPGIPNLALGNDISNPSHSRRLCYSGDVLAYIIFTSGTTGQPKGVMVGLESISRYVKEGGDLPFNFNTRHGTRVLLICSIAFDGMFPEMPC